MRCPWLALLVAAAFLLAGCNGGGDEPPEEPTPTLAPTPTTEQVALPLRPDQPALYVVNQDASGLRKLFEEGDFIDFEIAPDGERLAVDVYTGTDSLLFLIDPASGVREELARSQSIGLGGWSPDGGRLAFSRLGEPADESGFYLYDVDTGLARRVALDGAQFLAWSPDGAAIYLRRGFDPVTTYRAELPSLDAQQILSETSVDAFAVSPDGAWLAVGSFQHDGAGARSAYSIELVRVDGSERRELAQLGAETFVVLGLSWSPSGDRIAYGHVTAGDEGIASGMFVADVATGATTRLTQAMEGVDAGGQWSPDGERMLIHRHVCTQCDGPGSKVALAPTDGSGEIALPHVDRFLWGSSSWSPDGNRFAYTADGVYIADADGSNVRTLLAEPGAGYDSVVWSPDGGSLFFVRRAALPSTLYAARADGSGLEVLDARATSVAPDGHTLAFQNGAEVSIRRPDGSTVTAQADLAFLQDWSPDSSQLALVLNEEGRNTLAVLDTEGALRRLASANSIGSPRWSPDGRRIAYVSDRAVWVVAAAGGEPTQLTEQGVAGIDWSPDGDEIVFLMQGEARVVPADGKAEPRMLFPLPEGFAFGGPEVRWSPDGARVAVGDFSQLIVGSTRTGEVEQRLDAAVNGLAWSPDGRRLAFGSDGGRPNALPEGVHILAAEDGSLVQLTDPSERGHALLAWLDDGRVVFASAFRL